MIRVCKNDKESVFAIIRQVRRGGIEHVKSC